VKEWASYKVRHNFLNLLEKIQKELPTHQDERESWAEIENPEE
jgi:hypothetical protein